MSDERPHGVQTHLLDELTGGLPAEREARWKRYEWQLIPPEPTPPLLNMALDEVLTLRVGRGERPPTIRFWGWSDSCVVLGRFQSVRNEVDEEAMRANGVQLVRRISGGGAKFIEPEGAITYSIFAPEAMVAGMTFAESYAFFDAWVIDALRELGVDAWYAPLNDITSTGGKVGGAAQARRGDAVLHHTTMAYQMNIDLLTKVLRIGQEKLSDKGVTSAERRVGPLRQQTALDRDVIIHHLIGHFRARFGLRDDQITADELAEAKRLVDERFSTPEWLYFLP
ncbi:MAG: lipoate--protein ligase family protein [Chloroflexia bacterium]|nr:lipoate--protein ligase family protein [Chloroflexia bacterium]